MDMGRQSELPCQGSDSSNMIVVRMRQKDVAQSSTPVSHERSNFTIILTGVNERQFARRDMAHQVAVLFPLPAGDKGRNLEVIHI